MRRGVMCSPALRAALPWGALVGLWVWIAWPLLSERSRYFGGFVGDVLSARWYYHFVAEVVARGQDPLTTGMFGYPGHDSRSSSFPALVEGLIGVFFHLLADQPVAFHLVMASALLVNALGAALLARALGARGLGLFLAGGLGLTAAPAWRELLWGRPNALWVGLVTGALGLALLVSATGPGARRPFLQGGPCRSLVWLVILVLTFYLAGLVYPPHLVVVLPLGALLLLTGLRGASPRGLWLLCSAAAIAVVLGWSDLQELWSFAYERPKGIDIHCLRPNQALPPERWLVGWPGEGLWDWHQPMVPVGAWILAFLAPLHREGRRAAAVALVACVLLVPVSFGGCLNTPAVLDPLRQGYLRWGQLFSDPARVAIGLTGVTAALTGVGISALMQRRRVWARFLALALGGACLCQTTSHVLGHLDERMHEEPEDTLTPVLESLDPGPVAVLPYNLWDEMLSVLKVPHLPRYQPFRLGAGVLPEDPVARWLESLNYPSIRARPPTEEARRELPTSWVVLDPARCTPGRATDLEFTGCDVIGLAGRLTTVLGPSRRDGSGIRVWRLDLPADGAPASPSGD